jgi:hypothetical protein
MELTVVAVLIGLALAVSKEVREWLRFRLDVSGKPPAKPQGDTAQGDPTTAVRWRRLPRRRRDRR